MNRRTVLVLAVAGLAIIGAVLILYFVVDVVSPTAKIQSDQFTDSGQSIGFDGGDSSDNLGIVSYEWDYGDGDTGTGRTCVHTFASAGTFAVTLIVRDRGGNTATATTTIFVSHHHPRRMKLESEDFQNGSQIPSRFTCDGENTSPKLSWEDEPEGTKSFALSMIDPDAPGGEFIHWLIYDIPEDIRSLHWGDVPQEAKQLSNDAGTLGYTGPCPPRPSTHRYIFTLYALDIENLTEISREDFRNVVWVHALDTAVLMGNYQRES